MSFFALIFLSACSTCIASAYSSSAFEEMEELARNYSGIYVLDKEKLEEIMQREKEILEVDMANLSEGFLLLRTSISYAYDYSF